MAVVPTVPLTEEQEIALIITKLLLLSSDKHVETKDNVAKAMVSLRKLVYSIDKNRKIAVLPWGRFLPLLM